MTKKRGTGKSRPDGELKTEHKIVRPGEKPVYGKEGKKSISM
jgi:hypothetical protein